MTSARAMGLYTPGQPNPLPNVAFTSRIPARMYRHPSGLREFVPARLNPNPQLPGSAGIGDFVHARMNGNPQLPGSAGIGCCSCRNGMSGASIPSLVLSSGLSLANVETDFSNMMSGNSDWKTYALYGGGLVGVVYAVSALMSGGGRRRR